MRLYEVMKGIEHSVIRGGDAEISNVVIDSRSVRKGSLFFCIRGLKSDGHNFLPVAAEDGAAAAVIDRADAARDTLAGITIVKVEDSRKALAVASANFYGNPADSFTKIGITGTKGKTSSAFFCEAVLREHNRKTGLIGSVETRVLDEKLNIDFATSTTPDSIELHKIFSVMRNRGVTDLVMEVSSHALALDKLYGMRFDAALFTNLTQDHLDFHNDMKSYLAAKAMLFKMCGTGVVNADSDACGYIVEHADCGLITYGIDRECDLRAKNVRLLENGVSFDVNIDGRNESFEAGIGGRFTVYNLLGVLGLSVALGIPVETVKAAYAKLKGVPGRLQNVPNDRGFRVIVDFAHSPDSLKNIIEAVKEFTQGRVITVFGCGGDRDKLKRPIMGRIAGSLSDYCVLTSDNPRTEDPDLIIDDIVPGVKETQCGYERRPDRKEAIFAAINMAAPGDSVIIAGKGHEDYQIFADFTIKFDDYEVAQEALRS